MSSGADQPIINANALRQLAEEADGRRGEPLKVVRNNGGYELRNANDPGDALMLIETEGTSPKFQPIRRIDIDPPPDLDGNETIAGSFDALFWSASAVDKFLLPYYVRLLSPANFEWLRTAMHSRNVYALVHYPKTVTIDLEPRVVHDLPGTKGESGGTLAVSTLKEWARLNAVVENLKHR